MQLHKKENGQIQATLKSLKLNHFEDSINCIFIFSFQNYHSWTSPELLMDEKDGKVIFNWIIENNLTGQEINYDTLTTIQKRSLLEYINPLLQEAFDKENEFIRSHYTGHIKSDSYKNYVIDYTIDQYPKELLTFTDKPGEDITLRQSGIKNMYTKTDEQGEICRDKNTGLALYLSDEEIEKKGLNVYQTSIVAFNSLNKSVGLASDEWGADGIWVNPDYQGRGIGLALLTEFRKQFKSSRQMGQMTDAGITLARSYYRSNILKLTK